MHIFCFPQCKDIGKQTAQQYEYGDTKKSAESPTQECIGKYQERKCQQEKTDNVGFARMLSF
jgi:hypothetical protein